MRRKNDFVSLNKSKRWWNKYGYLVIIGICAAAAFAIIICINVFRPTTTDQQDTDATIEADATDTNASTSEGDATTEAALVSGKTYTSTAAVSDEAFNSADSFSDSVFIGDDFFSHLADYSIVDSSRVFAQAEGRVLASEVNTDSVKATNPSKIFIMYGRNDLSYGNGATPESISNKIIEFANNIKTACPNASIYIVSETPITKDLEDTEGTNVTEAQIEELNTNLSTKAVEAGMNYVDITGPLKNGNGYLNDDYSSNGYYVKRAYYGSIMNGLANAIK